jgi:hypothetical protein
MPFRRASWRAGVESDAPQYSVASSRAAQPASPTSHRTQHDAFAAALRCRSRSLAWSTYEQRLRVAPSVLARPARAASPLHQTQRVVCFVSGSIAATAAHGPFQGRWCRRKRRLRTRNVRIGRGQKLRSTATGANLDSVSDEEQEPGADAWENEGASEHERPEKSDRDEFFSNQEQLERPEHQSNGEKASGPGSNPAPSI